MRRFSFSKLWRERGGAISIMGGLGFLLVLVPVLLLLTNKSSSPDPTTTPGPSVTASAVTLLPPTARPTPLPPTPTPTLPARSARLNPQHGIHAPIGGQWTDPQRQALAGFRDAGGQSGGPGLVVALSTDLTANNNSAGARQEEDFYQYARQGAEVYVRMYPQRFPGGFSEPLAGFGGRNTISGTPQDAANDIFDILDAQQRRNGWHFTRIIPGNEPDLEWPDQLYGQNLLAWRSNGDPAKYTQINLFFSEVYRAWQRRVAQSDARLFQDVVLYFPALAQDGTADTDFYASFNYYDGSRPVGNRYDRLQTAVELYGRFSWHNYFQPGRACQDVTAAAFPDWLKQGLRSGWPALISEAGWAPDKLALATQNDSRARIVRFWQLLGVNWEKRLYTDDRPQWRTYDETIEGSRFEDDLSRFVVGCHLKGLELARPVGVAVWLAGSEGNFVAALGVEPGPNGLVRRWLREYANLLL